MQRALLVLLLIVAAGCAGAPPASDDAAPVEPHVAGPAGGQQEGARPNIWLLDGIRPTQSTKVSNGAEPSILADRDGEFLWIGDTTGAYYSQNNGTTWTKMANFLLPSVLTDGWALAQDDTGRLYAAGLIGPDIDVATSVDGKTWATINRAAAVSGTTDRPWLAAQGDGEVVLFYFDAPAVATGIWEHCARSTDKGATWLDRDPVSGSPQGGNAIFDDAGNFYYANDDGVVTRFAGSCAGSSETMQMFNLLGANNMIQVATDGTAIYSAAATGANKAIVVSGTKDFRRTHTEIVSPALLQSNTFATISVHGDQVAVAWYGSETPGDPSVSSFDGAFNVYVAIIDDFWGESIVRHIRVTDEPNHVGDICMDGIGCGESADRDLLDYFMIDHDKWGGIHIAYGHDGSSSNAVVRYAQIPASVARPPIEPDGSVDQPPVAAFTITANGLSVRADAGASSDPEGTPLSYVWNWGDGSANDAGKVALHSYPNFGAFTITLTVTDAAGHTAVTTQNVLVEEGERVNLLPVADFTASDALVGEAIRFTDRSKDADGTIVAWAWDFGDGATSDVASPTHKYASPGAKTVRLTVVDDWGESDSQTRTLHITAATSEVNGTEPTQDSGAGQQAPAPGVLLLLGLLVILARRR